MERLKDESYLSYCRRLVNSMDSKIIDYVEFGDSLIGSEKNNYSSENIRKFFYIFKFTFYKYSLPIYTF